MTKFSDNILTGVLPSATTPLALMLENVTSSFTLITRDETPKALIICEKTFCNSTNINFKISDKHRNHPTNFFRGGHGPPWPPRPRRHWCNGAVWGP